MTVRSKILFDVHLMQKLAQLKRHLKLSGESFCLENMVYDDNVWALFFLHQQATRPLLHSTVNSNGTIGYTDGLNGIIPAGVIGNDVDDEDDEILRFH